MIQGHKNPSFNYRGIFFGPSLLNFNCPVKAKRYFCAAMKDSNLSNRSIGIVGCGWLGSRLAKKWADQNRLYTTTTSLHKIEALQSHGFNPTLFNFSGGEETSAKPSRWSATRMLDVLIVTAAVSSRKENSRELIENRIARLHEFIGPFEGQMFFMDSTSVYPDVLKEFKEEDLPLEQVYPEKLFKQLYPQLNILRLGGLMGDDRQLSKYKVSDIESPVNHIHYKDIIGVIERMIERNSDSKVYNLVAPQHPSKRAVISKQKNEHCSDEVIAKGRLISSDLIREELEYDFLYPDPRLFHL